MNPNELFQQAKLGHPCAIAVLINRSLNAKGITAKVCRKDDCLIVLLEAHEFPHPDNLERFIRNGLARLAIAEINTIQVVCRQTGDNAPAWSQPVNLMPRHTSQSEPKSRPVTQTRPTNAAIQLTHHHHPKQLQADKPIRVRQDQRIWELTLQQLEQQIQEGKFCGTDNVWFQPTTRWIKARDHMETRHLFQASPKLVHEPRFTNILMKYEQEFISAMISLAAQTQTNSHHDQA